MPQLRWWNNHAWTEQTSAARQPMVVQDTKFAWADDDLPSRRSEREREREQERGGSATTDTVAPTVDSLRELEPPRAFAKIEQQPPAEAVAEGETFETPVTPTATAASDKWWSAPKAAESRRAAAGARQAAAAQAAAAQAAAWATPTAPAAAAPAQPVADANPFTYTAAPANSSFGSLFDAPPVAPTAAPQGNQPAAQPTAEPNPFAYTAAPPSMSFAALFDTMTAAAAEPATASSDESLGSLFGEPSTDAQRPVITPDLIEQPTRIVVGEKVLASTGPAWVIALVPLFQLVVSLLLVTSLGGTTNLAGAFVAILVVPYLVVVGLAYLDYRALVRGGNERPAHWAWAFLTAPVYLILRARATLRESGHGIGPILIWLGLAVLQVVSIVAIPGLIIAALPTVYAHEIESSVVFQAASVGSEMTVSCPVPPPVTAGQELQCTTVSNGKESNVVVTLTRANGWISWQVIDWGPYVQTAAS